MNDDSVNVWATLKTDLPELVSFSICSWVKFTYEVILCLKYAWFRVDWLFFFRGYTIKFGHIVMMSRLQLVIQTLFVVH